VSAVVFAVAVVAAFFRSSACTLCFGCTLRFICGFPLACTFPGAGAFAFRLVFCLLLAFIMYIHPHFVVKFFIKSADRYGIL
jgi:hypothetical protein